MIDRFLRALLVIGGVSAASAWTWPGVFPAADPVAVLVRYHTPNVYRAVVAWYYVAPGVAALLAGQLLISTSRIWFARMSVSVGLRSRLPHVAAFADGGRPGHRHRRSASPGQTRHTPETTHPTRGVEPDGPEAADDTTARLTGATVRLDLDPAGDAQDADGRILRYVMLPTGEHGNATRIREGYATRVPSNLYRP